VGLIEISSTRCDDYRRGVAQPKSDRPYMPSYGVPTEPQGMLLWSFAEERLVTSHDYWLATVWPDGRPHVMPVWGAWFDDHLWFSTDQTSRKARNLRADPRCVATTDNALEPVVLDGVAGLVTDRSDVAKFTDAVRIKYAAEWLEDVYTVDFFDANLGGGATYRVTPTSVFALKASEFTTSPTRWTF
jgi:PPOX class probable F420-dependent enzyme